MRFGRLFQVWHQLLFSSTELLSTVCVIHLCDSRRPVRPRAALVIMAVAAFHALAALYDQVWDSLFLECTKGY